MGFGDFFDPRQLPGTVRGWFDSAGGNGMVIPLPIAGATINTNLLGGGKPTAPVSTDPGPTPSQLSNLKAARIRAGKVAASGARPPARTRPGATTATSQASVPGVTLETYQPAPYSSGSALGTYQGLVTELVNAIREGDKGAVSQLFNTEVPDYGRSNLTPIDVAGLTKLALDPSAYAKNAAGAVYDANIGKTQTDLSRLPTELKSHLADINSWYGTAQKVAKEAGASNAAGYQQQLTGLDDQASGFMEALGGEANGGNADIAKSALIASAGLRGEGLAQSQFDNNWQSMLSADLARQQVGETNRNSNQALNLTQSLAAQKKERGQFEAKTLAEANAQRMSQVSALQQAGFQQNAAIEDSNFNRQQAGWNAKSTADQVRFNQERGLRQDRLTGLGTAVTAALGGAEAGPRLEALMAGTDQTRAQTGLIRANTASTAAQINQFQNGSLGFKDLQAGTRDEWATNIKDTLAPGGALAMSPSEIRTAIANRIYGTAGYTKSPEAETFINSVLMSTLSQSALRAYDEKNKTNYLTQFYPPKKTK